jgi:hypothetical protein
LLSYHSLRKTRYWIQIFAFFSFARCTPREIGLVLPALRVREVRPIVLVDGETETAFEGADVVAEAAQAGESVCRDGRKRGRGGIQVRVFLEVDGLQRELTETFAAVLVGRRVRGHTASTHFRADTSFVGHCCGVLLLLLLLLLGIDGSRG